MAKTEHLLRVVDPVDDTCRFTASTPARRGPAPAARDPDASRSRTKTTTAGRSENQEPLGSIRDGQALGEQGDDVTPGPLCVP